jgi:hypothetical protein
MPVLFSDLDVALALGVSRRAARDLIKRYKVPRYRVKVRGQKGVRWLLPPESMSILRKEVLDPEMGAPEIAIGREPEAFSWDT